MTKKTNNPTHKVFCVNGDGKDARWLEVGAAWPTKDQKGFTLSLNALPVNGRLVMRIIEAKTDENGGE